MKYRAEIDGLRALAVLPVILFHADFKLFSGGFVGVDVFFVISGYLITTILIQDIENSRFSILNFYERRARRILPALFFVVLVCIPISMIYLPPPELRNFFQSIVAVSLFASNVLFWKEGDWQEGGYFDSEALDKPLLHTWSLAVEEQYYVIFPIFLILAWRFGKNRVFWMIVGMAAVSLLLSEWGWRHEFNANFYLAPTRAWELLSGSIAAFIVHKQGIKTNNALSMLGLIMIAFSIFVYDESTPFPSIFSLVPIVGVVLLILYAEKNTVAAKILSLKPLVALGLISYSAYLVHQPMLVYVKLASLDGISVLTKSISVITILLIASLMWRYIETPFRKGMSIRNHGFLIASIICLSSFAIVGTLYHLRIIPQKNINLTWGGKSYLEPVVFPGIIVDGVKCSEKEDPSKSCIIGDAEQKIVIVGDSHARVLTQVAYESLSENNFTLVDMTTAGCVFLLGLHTFTNGNLIESCNADYQEKRMKFISTLKPSTIVLHARLPKYVHSDVFDNSIGGVEPRHSFYIGKSGSETLHERKVLFAQAFNNTISSIINAGHKVVIISPVPSNGWHPIKRLMRLVAKSNQTSNEFIRQKMAIPKGAIENRQAYTKNVLINLKEKFPELIIINSLDTLCDNSYCHSISKVGEILYADRDHLSLVGARMLFSELVKLKLLNK